MSEVNENLRKMKMRVEITELTDFSMHHRVPATMSYLNDQPDSRLFTYTQGDCYLINDDKDDKTVILAYEYEGAREGNRTIKVTQHSDGKYTISVVTIGEMHSRQTYQEDEWYSEQYFFAGKSMVLRNYTNSIHVHKFPEYAMITCEYELWSGESHMGYHIFNLVVGFTSEADSMKFMIT